MIAKKSVDRIEPLCELLNDVNPSLRRQVAAALLELAEVENLEQEILTRLTDVQNRNEWRACEQACFVLAKLDHKPSGERMVELLGHERGEVKVASAWGLTQLRIEALLPDMLDHAQSVYDGFKSKQLNDNMPGVSLHVAHLFIAFGDQRYSEAHPLLREYLPKSYTLGYEARPAAAWALGMLYEDDPQEDLAKIMVERMSDNGMEPEISHVQQMCAISLGRMKAESGLGALRKFANSDSDLGRACYWSIERMTGETAPPGRTLTGEIGGWFLEPIRDEGS
jgi:HEAT repeat protein